MSRRLTQRGRARREQLTVFATQRFAERGYHPTSVAEIVGGIGVVVTLVFVGVQPRQNTRAVQRSSAREAGNALVAAVQIHADSAELTELTLRALESLTPV